MRIGLDFDNTIVCYDQAIAKLGEEIFELPDEVPRTKRGLREYLRAAGREPEWTVFQGELYGPGMRYAQAFEGAIATMQCLVAEGHELFIISHRSLRPYAGTPYDLHAEARGWVAERLQRKGLFGAVGDEDCVHFLETLDKKVEMISHLGCDAFLDDLPEVLSAPGFPAAALGILFEPAAVSGSCGEKSDKRITTWGQLTEMLFSR